jgi:hypothetical protein
MMTSRQNRKARRAAERTARKRQVKDSALSAKVARQDEAALLSEPKSPKFSDGRETPPSISSISPAQLAANRANAQLSTGPTSEAGKAKSSKNALKTALTGRTVLLPEDDAERYEQHLLEYRKAYQPVGERECELVQSLADTTWRLDRIPGLEEALYAIGCSELAAEGADELDPRARFPMLRTRTYLAYERQFRNLNIQEMRLQRLREKLIAEIKQLQTDREQQEKEELAIAAKLYVAAKHDRKPFDPTDHGSNFQPKTWKHICKASGSQRWPKKP